RLHRLLSGLATYRFPPAFSAAVTALALRGSRLASVAVVLVVPSEEVEGVVHGARLVSPAWRSVEPLVHAPERVEPPRVRGVGVVGGPALDADGAHSGPFPRVRGPVGAGGGRPRREGPLCRRLLGRLRRLVAEVVFDGAGALLLLREGDVEVEVEVA